MMDTRKNEVLTKLIEYMDNNNLYCDYYPGVAEMGYEDKPMIAADWNPPKMKKIGDFIESYFDGEIEVEWSDEWTGCSECNKAVRTSPDSYGWTPSYMWTSDCSIACVECYADNVDDIIETYINSTRHAILPEFVPYLKEEGFVCYSPDEYCQVFETGFHVHQTDDPAKVAKDIEENLPDHDYIFQITGTGQFDISWTVWIRKKSYHEED
jgi:hypothetical protein